MTNMAPKHQTTRVGAVQLKPGLDLPHSMRNSTTYDQRRRSEPQRKSGQHCGTAPSAKARSRWIHKYVRRTTGCVVYEAVLSHDDMFMHLLSNRVSFIRSLPLKDRLLSFPLLRKDSTVHQTCYLFLFTQKPHSVKYKTICADSSPP